METNQRPGHVCYMWVDCMVLNFVLAGGAQVKPKQKGWVG